MKHIEVLEKLLREAKFGDEHGVYVDLTDSEINAIEWAINQLKDGLYKGGIYNEQRVDL